MYWEVNWQITSWTLRHIHSNTELRHYSAIESRKVLAWLSKIAPQNTTRGVSAYGTHYQILAFQRRFGFRLWLVHGRDGGYCRAFCWCIQEAGQKMLRPHASRTCRAVESQGL